MTYQIASNATDQCYEISFNGRALAAVGSYREALDYVGECKQHDAVVEQQRKEFRNLPRDWYGM